MSSPGTGNSAENKQVIKIDRPALHIFDVTKKEVEKCKADRTLNCRNELIRCINGDILDSIHDFLKKVVHMMSMGMIVV